MTAEEKKYEKAVPKKLTVKSDRVIGSLYAQMVGVVVTDIDITLEFVYLNPRPQIEEAHIVSRITLPRRAGESLSKAILDTIKEHEQKKKGRE